MLEPDDAKMTSETITIDGHTFKITKADGLFYSFVGTPDSGEFPPREIAIKYLVEQHSLSMTPAARLIDEYLRLYSKSKHTIRLKDPNA